MIRNEETEETSLDLSSDSSLKQGDIESLNHRNQSARSSVTGNSYSGTTSRKSIDSVQTHLQPVRPHTRELRKTAEEKLNKVQLLGSNASATEAGFYCDVCSVLSKNLTAHYDHLNSKRHQKAVGLSLKVERSTLEQVLSRISGIKERQKQSDIPITSELIDENIEKKRLEKKQAKENKRQKPETEQMSEDFSKDMVDAGFSFSSFGSTKKKK